MQSSSGVTSRAPAELDDRAEPRLAAAALEQGDLGAVQIAAKAQLLLGDLASLPGFAQVDGEAVAWFHGRDSLCLTTETLQTTRFKPERALSD